MRETTARSLGREDPLEEEMDRGAWWATVYGVAKSRTWLKQLSRHTHPRRDSIVAILAFVID